jgi:CubicO group peptidase (beta-lactamase class C family)
MRSARALALSLLAALAACGPRPESSRPQVDSLVEPLLRDGWTTAMVIGISRPQGDTVYGYGTIGPGGAVPGAHTIFEIGSVTKTFTGLALATMVEDGSVSLSTPVQDLIGPDPVIPTFDGQSITLQHLATHTSGLPRLPDNLDPVDPADPYADFDAAALDSFLAGYSLPAAPGTSYLYSNLGMGLLGRALALHAATDYAGLLQARVTGPLGMGDTATSLTAEQSSRLVRGHDGDLAAVPPWTWNVLAGAGALRSTASDLLRFVAAQSGAEPSPLASAMALSQVPRFRIDAATQTGLAWIIDDGGLVWHNGSTAGNESFVGFDPRTHTGIVVLSDTTSGFQPASQLGLALLSWVAGRGLGTVSLPVLATLPTAVLERDVGAYRFIDPDTAQPAELVVALSGGLLRASIGGGAPVGLYPVDETGFIARAPEVPAAVRFHIGPGNLADSLVFQFEGAPAVTATRVP